MKTHHTNVPRKVCKMTSDVHEQIKSFIGDYPAERGAMFGRDPDGIIRHCVLDTETVLLKAGLNKALNLLALYIAILKALITRPCPMSCIVLVSCSALNVWNYYGFQ